MKHTPQHAAWVVCGWLVLCLLAVVAVGGWWAQSRSDELVRPQQSVTAHEIGLSLATDVGKAVHMGIPVHALVGAPEWLSDVVTANPSIGGLALTDKTGGLLFQGGASDLPAQWLPTPLAEGEHVAGPWLVNTLAVHAPDSPQTLAWLFVLSHRTESPWPPWGWSLALALAAGVLSATALVWGVRRGMAQPTQQARQTLAQLANGQWPSAPALPPSPSWHGATAWALQARCHRVLAHTEAVLQKLGEVRAAHFDPAVLARVDALAAPLLLRQPHIEQRRQTRPHSRLLQRLTLLHKLWASTLLMGALALASALWLARLQDQNTQTGLVQAQQRLLTQAWQSTLTQDRLRMDAWLRDGARLNDWLVASTHATATPNGAETLLAPGLPMDMAISVLDARGVVVASSAPPSLRPQPTAMALAGLDKAPPALRATDSELAGSWQGRDHSFQTGLIRRVLGPGGGAHTVVLSRPVEPVLRETAERMGAALALADLRDQPADKAPSTTLDAWLQGDKANRLLTSDSGTGVLVSIPLASLSGHVLGTLVAHQTVAPRPDSDHLALVGLGWLGLALAAVGALWLLRASVHPVAQASQRLHQLASAHVAMADGNSTPQGLRVDALERAIEQINGQIDTLKALRRSRERQGRRQARFMRHQMMDLASSLDETARAGILADLKRIEEASQHEGPPADPMPHPPRTANAAEHLGFDTMADEVGVLALGFQNLVGRVGDQYQQLGRLVQELREALRVKTQFIAIQQELEIARKMQLSILPHDFSHQQGVHIHGTMQAAKEVGGDFYDFFRLDEHRLAITVADVSGKGIPAAFFMAVSRTLLRAVAQFSPEPANCLQRLNDLLAADNAELMFVTLFYAVVDTRTGHVVYGNAGHNPPYVLRANGAVEPVPSTGDMALAVMESLPYRQCALQLQPGDSLFMYTDGVTEACRADQSLFGEERLEALLASMVSVPVSEVAPRVLAAIKAFEDGNPQSDDITCLVVRRLPPPALEATPT